MKTLLDPTETPLEYIDGEVEFYKLMLHVDERTLIPRVETEFLVEHALKRLSGEERVLDLCCGSGAIGLALKSECPSLNVTLSDVSEDALEVAKFNAERHNLDVTITQGDLLEPFGEGDFDAVLCNPPYISDSDYETLQPSVKDFEPKLALVAGPEGMDFYERLERELPRVLRQGGKVFFEIGYDQGPKLLKLFSNSSWSGSIVLKDLSGHDRFFITTKVLQ